MPKYISIEHSEAKFIVDAEDYEKVIVFKWYLASGRVQKNHPPESIGQFLIGKIEGLQVDHIDRNILNNQKSNLRHVTDKESKANRGKHKRNTSGYKGVSFCKQTKKWKANIAGKQIGRYDTAIEAARAYNKRALIEFGTFAVINEEV